MTGTTLFSGIGAPEVALSEIDWKWSAEIEKFPSAVLKHRFPHVPNLGDVTRETFLEDAKRYGPIDLICAGSPCQDFSIAGTRAGMDGARGNLALRLVELVDAIRPRWLLFENVPGLLSSTSHAMPDSCRVFLEAGREGDFGYDADEGSDFGCFLAALSECGYQWAYGSLDAQFAGLAQRRERVFVVGYLGDWRPPAAVLFDLESLQGNPAPCRETREDTADTLGGCSGERGWCADTDRMTFVPDVSFCRNGKAGARIDGESETFVAGMCGRGQYSESPAMLRASGGDYGGGSEHLVAHSLSSEGFDASEDGTGRGVPLVATPLKADSGRNQIESQYIPETGHLIPEISDTIRSHTRPASNSANVLPELASTIGQRMRGQDDSCADNLIAFSCKDSGGDIGELAPTLRACEHDKSHANGGGQVAVASKMAVRRLTVVECARLQGFQDLWCHIPWKRRKIVADEAAYLQRHGLEVQQEAGQWYTKVAADGPMYRAYGNSMAVPVIRWIGQRIMAVDEMLRR